MNEAAAVSIVGFGACTSLGYSLGATLAAMDGGLNNFSDTSVPDEFGHPAVAASLVEPELGRGERIAALVRHGLHDIRLTVRGLGKLPLCLGVAADLEPDERALLRRALAEQRSVVSDVDWFPHGRASAFAALAAALDMLTSRSHRLVLVGGVDSMCAPAKVSSLVQAGRVLGPLTEGTIPGEGAALALLARSDDPIVDPARSVRLEAVALDRAAVPFTKAEVVSADGLASAFRTLRTGGAARVHQIVAAHSGEGYFGRSFAHAYLRELEIMPEPLSVEVIADRVGDVGAAAGLVGLALGVYLMVRDRQSGLSRVLVYSESDTGEVGAAILDGTPAAWPRRAAAPAAGSGR
jgi:3-oxoacyl-[acyl-carrier-protein] synthase-1